MTGLPTRPRPAWRLIALLLLGLLAACAQPPSGPQDPGDEWLALDTRPGGIDCRRQLDAVDAYLRTLDSTALLAVRDGRVLFRYGDTAQVGPVFSVRKSILSMLFGPALGQGAVSLDSRLADLGIDDIGGLQPGERQARLRDLLAARSGIYHPAANGGDDSAVAPPRGSQPPGSYFLYNNWDFNAAGSIFEQSTGLGIYQAFTQQLAEPLRLQDWDPARHRRSGDASRSQHLSFDFQLSTRDMARLGWLMLRQGRWDDRPLLPADWVQDSTRTVTPASDMHPAATARRGLGYGYLWWTLDEPAGSPLHGAYMAWGLYGQFILVAPAAGLVVAHQRHVAPGQAAPSTVRPRDFLRAATALAQAPCGGP